MKGDANAFSRRLEKITHMAFCAVRSIACWCYRCLRSAFNPATSIGSLSVSQNSSVPGDRSSGGSRDKAINEGSTKGTATMNQDQIKSLDEAMAAMVAAETGYNTAQAAVQPAKEDRKSVV